MVENCVYEIYISFIVVEMSPVKTEPIDSDQQLEQQQQKQQLQEQQTPEQPQRRPPQSKGPAAAASAYSNNKTRSKSDLWINHVPEMKDRLVEDGNCLEKLRLEP